MKDKDTAKTLQTVLDSIIIDKGWDDQLALAKLQDSWEEILGASASKAVRLKSLIRGKLTLTAESSTWRTEMQLRKDSLKDRINSILNKDLIAEVVIK